MQATNHNHVISSTSINKWAQNVYSPLAAYDENFELYNVLAGSIEFSNGARRAVVELKDHSFHNDERVTADDVQFTFQHIWDNADVYPQAFPVNYESIEIVDDKTTEFNFAEPTLPAETLFFPK